MSLTAIFCDADDFYKVFIPAWQGSLLPEEKPQRHRQFTLSPAEVMTLFRCRFVSRVGYISATRSRLSSVGCGELAN